MGSSYSRFKQEGLAMTDPMLARIAAETPHLLPLVAAVKRGVKLLEPLKGEPFPLPRSSRAILWLCDDPAGGPRYYNADSLRRSVETALYVIAGLSDPSVYQRAADHAVAGDNIIIIETDRSHAWEWSEFLSAIPCWSSEET
jgi:hypothetical protein